MPVTCSTTVHHIYICSQTSDIHCVTRMFDQSKYCMLVAVVATGTCRCSLSSRQITFAIQCRYNQLVTILPYVPGIAHDYQHYVDAYACHDVYTRILSGTAAPVPERAWHLGLSAEADAGQAGTNALRWKGIWYFLNRGGPK